MRLRARGRATPDEVWDRYVRPTRWAEWSPQIKRVDSSGDRLLPGMTGTVHGPLGVSVDFEVESVQELPLAGVRSWSWRAWRGPIQLHLHHTVVGIDGGTDTELHIQGFTPVVLAYVPIAQLALVRLVRP